MEHLSRCGKLISTVLSATLLCISVTSANGANAVWLQDDFDDGDNSGWATTLGEWDATLGYNVALGLYDGWAYTYTGDAYWENYTFDVDVTFGTANTEFIVAVRVDPTSSPTLIGGSQYYLSLDGDDDAIRLRYTVEPSGFYDLLTLPYSLLDEATYHISVSIFENKLVASIDGDPILDYQFSGATPIYHSGAIAIGYQSGDGPDGAYFDNVVVTSTEPALECVGFGPPMANYPVTVKKNRALPLKAQLFDADGYALTNADLLASPVLQVLYEAGLGGGPMDATDDALSSRLGTEGNQFVFTDDGYWQFNLKTNNYTASGTYTIFMDSGDASEYVIEPTCETSFVIQ